MSLPRVNAARAACVACALALSACATFAPDRAPGSAAPVYFAPARAAFEASGRISVRHGTDALTANFRWRHDGAKDEIDLASPLGQTLARLAGAPGAVELRFADGRVATATDWAALTSRSLAWALPVDGLAFWIQGAPRPGADFARRAGGRRRPGAAATGRLDHRLSALCPRRLRNPAPGAHGTVVSRRRSSVGG